MRIYKIQRIHNLCFGISYKLLKFNVIGDGRKQHPIQHFKKLPSFKINNVIHI